jgi:hypothetical protein
MQFTCDALVYPDIFPARTKFTWDVTPDPDYGGINGYLAVAYGNYDYNAVSITSRQAYTITDLVLNVDWTFSGNAATGLLCECYLTTASHSSGPLDDKLCEVGFLPKVSSGAQAWASGLPSLGSFVDSNGVTWQVRESMDASATFPYYVAYRSGFVDHKGAFVFDDYFAFLINLGKLTGNEWFNGVAFGPEPHYGAANVIINSLTPTYAGAARVPWTLSSLTANAQQTEVVLQWKHAGGATSHQYRMNGGTWTTTSSSTTHTVTGLTASTAYTFEVRGVNSTGNGAASNLVNITTLAQPHALPATNLLRRWRADSIAQANNTAVATWPALIGGVDLTQATAGDRPTYVTNRQNGKPAVTWGTSANTMHLGATGFTVQAQPVTITAICKPSEIAATMELLGFSGGGNNAEMYMQSSKWRSWANAELISTGNATANAWVVFTFVLNGSTSALYINGTQVASGSGGNATLRETFFLGRHPTNGLNWRGDIGEVIIYTGAADATTRAQIHSYVQDYWGITVTDYTV